MVAPISAFVALLISFAPAPPTFERVDGAAVDGQTVLAPASAPVQRIAILPDRTTGRDWGLPYLRQAVTDLNRIGPDAVFTIGDMIQGYTRDATEWQRQADEYLEIVRSLTMPLFPVAGNHDVIGGMRRTSDRTFAELYRRVFGPLWYSVDLELATMVLMFSDEGLGDANLLISDEQMAWLEQALIRAQARGKPTVILLHRPLWRSAAARWSERVQPLLERTGVRAVIAGHFHSMQRDPTVGAVDYHIVGVCGGAIDQHPLAGQMQHLTFLDIHADGSIRVHHQPAGVTLPEDWVVRADQDRVLALRSRNGVLTWKGTFVDPMTITTPAIGEVELEFRNPLDVPVEVMLQQIRTMPTPWLVDRENFISWTPVDNFNPHITQLVGPFNISALTAHPVAPGDVTQIPVRLRAIPTAEAVQPPPIEFRVELRDRKGRTVPVFIPLRLPIQRVIPLPPNLEAAVPYPICVWEPSPYDRLEANPTCRLALERGSAGDTLLVEVRVPDVDRSAFEGDDRPFEQRRDDPIADAVRFEVNTTQGKVEVLTEPFAARLFGATATADAPEPWPNGAGWTQRIRVPWPGGRFEPTSAPTVNIGVADNDDTYHTQWRWLSPRQFPARVHLPAASPRGGR